MRAESGRSELASKRAKELAAVREQGLVKYMRRRARTALCAPVSLMRLAGIMRYCGNA